MKELWPGWETVEAIGSGGFSKVYKIRKRETGDERDYYSALKIISIPQSSDEYDAYLGEGYDDDTITGIFTSQVKRIVEEFHMMSRFRGNSNIVSYEDHMIVPHEDGKGWEILIRMELLTSLTKHCTKSTMSEEETVKLGIGICRALELCQKMNIIHRDIKPQNIFVNEFGDYKLGDFGIAKSMDHTTHATKTGTYSYMAPEVYRGEAYGSTIDLYSLGLVLYWLLNERRLPFLPLPPEAPTAAQINESQVRRLSGEALPAPKNGSDDLKRIVLKACAHNAADRYATAAAMRRDLEKALFVLEATAEEAVVAVPVAAVAVSEPAGVANDADDGNEKTEGLFSYHAPVVSVVAEKAAEESAEEADEAQETAGSFSQAAPVAVETEAEEAVDKSDATVGLFGGHTVKASAEPAENTAEEESNPIPEPVSTPAPAPAPAPAPTPVPAPAPKKSGKGKWFAIISGVLLVVVVVVLLLLRGCEDGEGTGTETTTNGIDGIVDPDATTPSSTTSALDEPSTEPAVTVSEGLKFELKDDGTYSVAGIGTCTDTDVVIPATYRGRAVTGIGFSAFYECTGLTSITIPDSVMMIGQSAFNGCTSLTTVAIPDGVTMIDDSAFNGCTSLTTIMIPDSVTSIGMGAFVGCTSLANITIPEGIKRIEHAVFQRCESLLSITIPNSVTSIGETAFYGCTSLTSITIPNSVTQIDGGVFMACTGLVQIHVQNGNPYYHSSGNCLIETQTKTLISACQNSVIPDDGSVLSIRTGAFSGLTNLTNITIPDSINNISFRAFYGCENLTSVTFENTSGWYVTETEDAASGTYISLSDPATAAKYLTGDYVGYYWYWSDNSEQENNNLTNMTDLFIPYGNATVDGIKESYWTNAATVTLDLVKSGNPAADTEVTASVMWDENRLYFLFEIIDSEIYQSGNSGDEKIDGICLYVSEDPYANSSGYDSFSNGIYQFVLINNNLELLPKYGTESEDALKVQSAYRQTATGMIIEFSYVPEYASLEEGQFILLDYQYNDAESSGDYMGSMGWYNGINLNDQPALWGIAKLVKN